MRRLRYSVLAVLAVLLIVQLWVLPTLVKRWTLSALKEGCSDCRLTLGSASVWLIPLSVTLYDVDFGAGRLATTYAEVHADKVVLRPRLELGAFRSVEVLNPRVVITEGDEISKPGPPPKPNPKPLFKAAKVRVRGGTFAYVRQRKTKQARLDIADIDADVESLLLPPQPVWSEGSAQGVLEGSGEFILRVTSSMEDNRPNVQVWLSMHGLEMSKLKFFAQDDAIKLAGRLVDGKAEVNVKGRKAKATVEAFYKDLSVTFESNEERSGFAALVMDVVASIKLSEENLNKAQSQRKRSVTIYQKPRESIIAFILRALKDAALDVSSQ